MLLQTLPTLLEASIASANGRKQLQLVVGKQEGAHSFVTKQESCCVQQAHLKLL
jgi:hypothetical protein